MSKITEELRELTRIAGILGRTNGSVDVRTIHEPAYEDREIFKKISEAIKKKVEALNGIPDELYVNLVTGAEKPEIAQKIKLFFKEGETQEQAGQAMFDEMEAEKITPPEKELLDSVEQHAIDTTKEPSSEADPRD